MTIGTVQPNGTIQLGENTMLAAAHAAKAKQWRDDAEYFSQHPLVAAGPATGPFTAIYVTAASAAELLTTGFASIEDRGAARYIADSLADAALVARFPRLCAVDTGGMAFRITGESITPEQAGSLPGDPDAGQKMTEACTYQRSVLGGGVLALRAASTYLVSPLPAQAVGGTVARAGGSACAFIPPTINVEGNGATITQAGAATIPLVDWRGEVLRADVVVGPMAAGASSFQLASVAAAAAWSFGDWALWQLGDLSGPYATGAGNWGFARVTAVDPVLGTVQLDTPLSAAWDGSVSNKFLHQLQPIVGRSFDGVSFDGGTGVEYGLELATAVAPRIGLVRARGCNLGAVTIGYTKDFHASYIEASASTGQGMRTASATGRIDHLSTSGCGAESLLATSASDVSIGFHHDTNTTGARSVITAAHSAVHIEKGLYDGLGGQSLFAVSDGGAVSWTRCRVETATAPAVLPLPGFNVEQLSLRIGGVEEIYTAARTEEWPATLDITDGLVAMPLTGYAGIVLDAYMVCGGGLVRSDVTSLLVGRPGSTTDLKSLMPVTASNQKISLMSAFGGGKASGSGAGAAGWTNRASQAAVYVTTPAGSAIAGQGKYLYIWMLIAPNQLASALDQVTTLDLVRQTSQPTYENAVASTLNSSISAGASLMQSVSTIGLVAGDFAESSFSVAVPAGLTKSTQAVADAIEVRLSNPTGSPITGPAGTLTVQGRKKRTSYVVATTTLNALGGTFSLPENAAAGAVIGPVTGLTAGSTPWLFSSAGGRFVISGGNLVFTGAAPGIDYETATSHVLIFQEDLAGASNTGRQTTITVTITNVLDAATLASALTPASATMTAGAATGTLVMTFTNKTPGSVLTLSNTAGGRYAIANGNELRTTSTATASATYAPVVVETLSDSPNSPISTTLSIVAGAAPSVSITTQAALLYPAGESDPIVDHLLSVTPAVVAGAAVASRSYQWLRGGATIGSPQSTPPRITLEADAAAATRGLLKCQETITFVGGAVLTSVTADSPMPRRTAPTLAYGYGRGTKQTEGAVLLSSAHLGLLGAGAARPSAITTGTASTGTDAHWVRTNGAATVARTPQISATGVTAVLSDALYVFPVQCDFADGIVETTVLTVTPLNGVATVGQFDSLDGFNGATRSGQVDGQIIELAAGIELVGRKYLRKWRFTAATIFRAHDLTRILWPLTWELQSCKNVTLDDLDAARVSASSVSARYVLTLYPGLTSPCENIIFNRPLAIGDGTMFTTTDAPAVGFQANNALNCTVNDAHFEYVLGGFKGGGTAGTVVNMVINRPKLRYYWYDSFISGTGDDWIFNDAIWMSPMRLNSGAHGDGWQTADTAINSSITVNRGLCIAADGTQAAQGVFGGNATNVASDGSNANIFKVENFIYIGAQPGAVSLGNSGPGSYVKKVHAFYEDTFLGSDQAVVRLSTTRSCNVSIQGTTKHAGGGKVADRLVVFGDVTVTAPGWTVTNAVKYLEAPGSAYAAAHDVSPTAALPALDYANMSFDAVVTAVKAIVKPKAGGSYQLGDLSYISALLPDGSWNPA